ncbi:MAG: NAD-dependent epimerase/dehydratase family protein [Candidatus Pacebacteria bacterium]|nr:NAD-dependent epimerase/dehydratase family protein [Candidatus Paceibacterota bacterium]MBT6756015.1 NAD-dependent epimerase/dehydratase family protein [Candidatus Paceibacterota bacterium]MBT6920797.1 NAD-dependent epimerase/dehydratase family protein [Candidatus Paceibacterota bacterium]
MKENILITGGTGFVGTHLVEELINQGISPESIHVTTLNKKPHPFLDKVLPETNFHQINLTEPEPVLELFSLLSPAVIYNLASFSAPGLSLEKKSLTLSVNTNIQLNVLEAMLAHTPQARLLSIGSGTEYAQSPHPLTETSPIGPRNPYAVSKATQDMLAHSYHTSYDLDIVRVRPFNHIGEFQARGFVIPDFVYQITQEIEKGVKDSIHVGNLDVRRDFSDVKDVVKAYVLLMSQGISGEVYNIGSGIDISIQELLEKLKSFSSIDFPIIIDEDKKRSGETDVSVADISKIRALGWEPTIPIDTTLKRIVQWWRNQ